MGGPKKIDQTCKAIRAEKITMELGPEGGGTILPNDPIFVRACAIVFRIAEHYQKNILLAAPRLWTAPLIHTAAAYAKKHGLTLKFTGPNINPEAKSSPVATAGNTVHLQGFGLAPRDAKALLRDLGHEHGHTRDIAIIEKYFPQMQNLLRRESGTADELVLIANTYLKAILLQIPEKEWPAFMASANAVLGAIRSPEMTITVIKELFRYGEEVTGPHVKQELKETTLKDVLRTLHARPYEHRLLLVARYQEAGIWEEITKRKDFNPKGVADLKPAHLAFFRQCIRAASKHFTQTPRGR